MGNNLEGSMDRCLEGAYSQRNKRLERASNLQHEAVIQLAKCVAREING
jgi:hypothetical protein